MPRDGSAGKSFWTVIAAALVLAGVSLLAALFVRRTCGPAGGAEDVPAEVRTLAQGSARLVWCQDAGEGGDVAARGTGLRLMGFDTDDGRGERRILDALSNYAKPMLTPDGTKIIFSNRKEQAIYVVGFDGSGLARLAPGIALAVWRDAAAGTDWVYAGTAVDPPDAVFNSTIINARRFRLDKPQVSEPVWSRTALNLDNFQLSADGRHAGGQFPWPTCGLAALPDRGWEKIGDGCWPSLSPDNERLLWYFDGAHRNLNFLRTQTGERWVVNINHAPGIGGYEVYHPRWSNHARFMVMTGPYQQGEGDNRIGSGGREVEIFMGRFSADFKAVERWVQVTRNPSADFCPALWIANRPAADPAGAEGAARPAGSGWPGSQQGLVFLWQNRSKANTLTDPATRRSRECRVAARGRARYGRHFEMAPSGGAFVAEDGDGGLVEACAASGQLAVEMLIEPDAQAAPDRLLPVAGYAARPGGWNFLVGQRGRELVFKARAAGGGPDYTIPLGELPGSRPCHVLVSCLPGSVACYLNGEAAGRTDSIQGGRWEPGALVFGGEWQQAYAVNGAGATGGWQGLIENIAVHSRWIGPEEARQRYTASAAPARSRQPIPAVVAEATLIAMPNIPAPASIAPYRRALAFAHYRIDAVLSGRCSSREAMVAQWVILDGQVLESARAAAGETSRLRLEAFSDHPELEGERQILDSDRYDLPVYYATSIP